MSAVLLALVTVSVLVSVLVLVSVSVPVFVDGAIVPAETGLLVEVDSARIAPI